MTDNNRLVIASPADDGATTSMGTGAIVGVPRVTERQEQQDDDDEELEYLMEEEYGVKKEGEEKLAEDDDDAEEQVVRALAEKLAPQVQELDDLLGKNATDFDLEVLKTSYASHKRYLSRGASSSSILAGAGPAAADGGSGAAAAADGFGGGGGAPTTIRPQLSTVTVETLARQNTRASRDSLYFYFAAQQPISARKFLQDDYDDDDDDPNRAADGDDADGSGGDDDNSVDDEIARLEMSEQSLREELDFAHDFGSSILGAISSSSSSSSPSQRPPKRSSMECIEEATPAMEAETTIDAMEAAAAWSSTSTLLRTSSSSPPPLTVTSSLATTPSSAAAAAAAASAVATPSERSPQNNARTVSPSSAEAGGSPAGAAAAPPHEVNIPQISRWHATASSATHDGEDDDGATMTTMTTTTMTTAADSAVSLSSSSGHFYMDRMRALRIQTEARGGWYMVPHDEQSCLRDYVIATIPEQELAHLFVGFATTDASGGGGAKPKPVAPQGAEGNATSASSTSPSAPAPVKPSTRMSVTTKAESSVDGSTASTATAPGSTNNEKKKKEEEEVGSTILMEDGEDLPIRIVTMKLRPDVLVGAVMDGVASAFHHDEDDAAPRRAGKDKKGDGDEDDSTRMIWKQEVGHLVGSMSFIMLDDDEGGEDAQDDENDTAAANAKNTKGGRKNRSSGTPDDRRKPQQQRRRRRPQRQNLKVDIQVTACKGIGGRSCERILLLRFFPQEAIDVFEEPTSRLPPVAQEEEDWDGNDSDSLVAGSVASDTTSLSTIGNTTMRTNSEDLASEDGGKYDDDDDEQQQQQHPDDLRVLSKKTRANLLLREAAALVQQLEMSKQQKYPKPLVVPLTTSSPSSQSSPSLRGIDGAGSTGTVVDSSLFLPSASSSGWNPFSPRRQATQNRQQTSSSQQDPFVGPTNPETVTEHLLDQFKACPSVRQGKLTLPALSPDDWPLVQASWGLVSRIWNELEGRHLVYSTLSSSSPPPSSTAENSSKKDHAEAAVVLSAVPSGSPGFGQPPALPTLDAHFCSQIRRLCREGMVQSLLKSSSELELYARQAEYDCASLVQLLQPTYGRYELAAPSLPHSLPLTAYPLDFTPPQAACPPWGKKVMEALDKVAAMNGEVAKDGPNDPASEAINATANDDERDPSVPSPPSTSLMSSERCETAVRMVFQAFVDQNNEEETARLGRKNLQVMDRLAKMQAHQLVSIAKLAQSYRESAHAQKAADEFHQYAAKAVTNQNAQKQRRARQPQPQPQGGEGCTAGNLDGLDPEDAAVLPQQAAEEEVPLLSCSIAVGNSTGVCYVTSSRIMCVTHFLPLMGDEIWHSSLEGLEFVVENGQGGATAAGGGGHGDDRPSGKRRSKSPTPPPPPSSGGLLSSLLLRPQTPPSLSIRRRTPSPRRAGNQRKVAPKKFEVYQLRPTSPSSMTPYRLKSFLEVIQQAAASQSSAPNVPTTVRDGAAADGITTAAEAAAGGTY